MFLGSCHTSSRLVLGSLGQKKHRGCFLRATKRTWEWLLVPSSSKACKGTGCGILWMPGEWKRKKWKACKMCRIRICIIIFQRIHVWYLDLHGWLIFVVNPKVQRGKIYHKRILIYKNTSSPIPPFLNNNLSHENQRKTLENPHIKWGNNKNPPCLFASVVLTRPGLRG